MFTAKDIQIQPLDSTFILSKISEYEIFKAYIPNFTEINKSFKSEFYNDGNPACRVYQKADNTLRYHDFGTGDDFSCFDYVCRKYNLTFSECLKVIANDFGLIKGQNIALEPRFLIGKENIPKEKENWSISVIMRNWDINDYNYWSRYNLTLDEVEKGGYFPISYTYLNKLNITRVFKSEKHNPMYACKEYNWENNEFIGYKIYRPLNIDIGLRWISTVNVGKSIIGWQQLPKFGDILIWSKARKDVIIYNKIGFNAISAQSENSYLPQDAINQLIDRFNSIYIQLDNDNSGKKFAEKLQIRYNFRILDIGQLTKYKDLGQMSIYLGLEESKIIIDKLINDSIKKG